MQGSYLLGYLEVAGSKPAAVIFFVPQENVKMPVLNVPSVGSDQREKESIVDTSAMKPGKCLLRP